MDYIGLVEFALLMFLIKNVRLNFLKNIVYLKSELEMTALVHSSNVRAVLHQSPEPEAAPKW